MRIGRPASIGVPAGETSASVGHGCAKRFAQRVLGKLVRDYHDRAAQTELLCRATIASQAVFASSRVEDVPARSIVASATCRRVRRNRAHSRASLDDLHRRRVSRIHFERPNSLAIENEIDAEQADKLELLGQHIADAARASSRAASVIGHGPIDPAY